MYPAFHSSFMQALGWSLIESLWQMGALWTIYVLITENLKKSSASFRYLLAMTLLSVGSMWFIINIYYNYNHQENSLFHSIVTFTIFRYLPYISFLYLLIITFIFIRWVYQYIQYNKTSFIADSNNGISSLTLQNFVDRLRTLYNLQRKIVVKISAYIHVPLTKGLIKPVILLPVTVLTQLNTAQIEALVAHEFYHIRRNDYFAHLLSCLMSSLLFFNPFAQWLLQQIQKERENCCDDEVIKLGYDRRNYAEALFIISKNAINDFSFGTLAATGKNRYELLNRVKRLLNIHDKSGNKSNPLVLFFLIIMITANPGKIHIVSTTSGFPVTHIQPLPLRSTANAEPTFDNQKNSLPTSTVVKSTVSAKYLHSPANDTSLQTRKFISQQSTIQISAYPLSEENTLPKVDSEDGFDQIVTASVSEEPVISYAKVLVTATHFSYIESEINSFPKPANMDPTQPFVAASTFYFPDHEMQENVSNKTIVEL